MQLDQILPAFSLLLPGVVTIYFIDRIEQSKKKDHDSIERLIHVLIAGIIPSISTMILLNLFFDVTNNLSESIKNMTEFKYLSSFLIISVVISFVWSVIWVKGLRPFTFFVLNDFRKGKNLSELKNETVWGQFFDSDENAIVHVYHISYPSNGIWGIIDSATEPHESDRDIRIIGSSEIVKYISKLNKVKESFIDAKTGIVIDSYEFDENTFKD